MSTQDAYNVTDFPAWRRPWWRFLHALCYLWFAVCYRFRAFSGHRIPKRGALLVVANHQSFYDPILVGLGLHKRPFWALARKTLFNNPKLAWLIRSLNAIPVDQDASDTKSMRACIDVLKADRALVIYPEGARTLTGKTEAFSPGTMMLIKRAKPMVLPVAIEGAFDVWPRTAKNPRPFGKIVVQYGEPIDADTLLNMGNAAALEHLRQTIEAMRQDLRHRIAPDAV